MTPVSDRTTVGGPANGPMHIAIDWVNDDLAWIFVLDRSGGVVDKVGECTYDDLGRRGMAVTLDLVNKIAEVFNIDVEVTGDPGV